MYVFVGERADKSAVGGLADIAGHFGRVETELGAGIGKVHGEDIGGQLYGEDNEGEQTRYLIVNNGYWNRT